MAIQKRFIHFKKFSDFNSKKLSANEANTQYTVGVSGAIQDGDPDILYQSYVWIKDTKQQWTHARLYGNDFTVNLTYEELKSLRDSAQLIPGQQYRITDYVTTTTQENTRSAGHPFDIIVTADNENTLNEVARACRSEFDIENYKDAYSYSWTEDMLYVGIQEYEGKKYHLYESYGHDLQMLVSFGDTEIRDFDQKRKYSYELMPAYIRQKEETSWGEWCNGKDGGEFISFKYNPNITSYFKDSNLAAWQIWYSLDNDVERFAWALSEHVRCNDTYRFPNEIRNQTIKVTKYDEEDYYIFDSKVVYTYTLSDSSMVYFTEAGDVYNEAEVSIGQYDIVGGKGVIYRMIDEWNNDCPYDFKNIKLKDVFWYKTFSIDSNNCTNNIINSLSEFGTMVIPLVIFSFESFCHNNIVKPNCDKIFLGTQTGQGSNLQNNIIGYGCSDFYLSCSDIYDNVFGDYCSSFAIQCQTFTKNKIGSRCSSIQMSYTTMRNNTIGSDCTIITDYGSIDYLTDSIIGDQCTYLYVSGDNLKIGNCCHRLYIVGSHAIGNFCSDIYFTHKRAVYPNYVGDGCWQIGAKQGQMTNCHFGSGCNNINWNKTYPVDSVIFEAGTSSINVSLQGQLSNEYYIKSGHYNNKVLSNYFIHEYPCSYATVSYDQLVTLRDNGHLSKGAKYRIIDYETTTSQKHTQSAGHRFDVIVTALDEYTLSEEAQVARSAVSGYFDESNLSAWKIWYSLDNDTERFSWADTERIEEQLQRNEIADSSQCVINSELIDGNTFITPFNFTSCVWVDSNKTEYDNNHDFEEPVYEWDYFNNPQTGKTELCIYKSSIDLYEEEGCADYEDKYLYRGVVTVDGEDYDYWQKYEQHDNPGLFISELGYVYATTPRIVTNPEVYTSETNVVTREKVIQLNPKGVIYRMIDEFGNDCPYDFKNIQFKRWKITTDLEDVDKTPLESYYSGYATDGSVPGASLPFHTSILDPYLYKWCYTFSGYSDDSAFDASLGMNGLSCSLNKIESYKRDGIQYLNDIVIKAHANAYNKTIKENIFSSDCFSNTIGCENDDCEVWDNRFGQYSKNSILIGPVVVQNTFDSNATALLFAKDVNRNNIAKYMQNNFFGSRFNQNEIGPMYKNNVVLGAFSINTVGEQMDSNTISKEFTQNVVGAAFQSNTLLGKFTSNSIGNVFMRNTVNTQMSACSFGIQSVDNTFGTFKNCSCGSMFMSNSIGDALGSSFGIGFNSNKLLGTNTQVSTFGNYVMYTEFNSTGSIMNINVSNNIRGTADSYYSIDIPENSVCELKVAKNSSGDIKVYCDSDLIA